MKVACFISGLLSSLLAMGQVTNQGFDILISKSTQFHQSNADSALYYATAAIRTLPLQGNDSLLHELYQIQSRSYFKLGDQARGVAAAQKVLDFGFPYRSGRRTYANAIGAIGRSYMEMGRYDSALVYSLHFDRLIDSSFTGPDAKWDLSQLYYAQGNTELASKYALQAIDRARAEGTSKQLTISLYYYLKINENQWAEPDVQPLLDEYLRLTSQLSGTGHSDLLLLDKTPEEQVKLLEPVVAGLEELHPINAHRIGMALVSTYAALDMHRHALILSERLISLSRAHDDIPNLIISYKSASQMAYLTADYRRAFDHNKVYQRLRDSMNSVTVQKNMADLQIRYETATKEGQLAIQQSQLQKKTMQRNISIVIAAALLWFGTFIVLFFRNKNKLTQKLAAQRDQLNAQKISQLENDKKILAMSSMIEGQEAERMRIAHDLHDGLGGLLGTVKSHISTIQGELQAIESLNIYKQVNALIDNASDEVRRISRNMAPHALEMSGLKAALSDLVEQARSHGIEAHFSWNGSESRLPEATERMIYRVAQELVNNIVKHANASTLLLQFNQYPGEVNLIVEDDGHGFDTDEALHAGGLGLQSVKSRVAFLNGAIDIESTPGKGSSFTIQVPLD